MGCFDDSGGAFDFGVYPVGLRTPRARPVASLDIPLRSEAIGGRAMVFTDSRYQSAPAEIMEIFHRLNQAGMTIFHPNSRAYEVALGRLLEPEYDKVMAWVDAEDAKLAPAVPPSAPSRPLVSMPSPRVIPKKGHGPRLSSDPAAPKIEV